MKSLRGMSVLKLRSVVGLAFVVLSIGGCGGQDSQGAFLTGGQWVDLTHAFDENAVYWPTADGFELTQDAAGMTDGGYYYSANSFRAAEHGGTHIDAPIHFAQGRRTLDEIPLIQGIGEGVRIDVSEECANDPDYRINTRDLVEWERVHGVLPDEAILLFYTGFSQYWPDRERYMGTADRGVEATTRLHFPGLSVEAAQWLVDHRRIKAVGIDTPSIDHGPSTGFEAHRVLFDRNVPAFENVASLHKLPNRGFVVVAFPMKISGGTGGPLRIAAWLPEE